MEWNVLGKDQMVCNSLQADCIKYGSVGESHMEYSSIEEGWLECIYLGEGLIFFR
jgi:hypothetical protein